MECSALKKTLGTGLVLREPKRTDAALQSGFSGRRFCERVMKIAFRLVLVLALILLVLWAISASVSTTATENDFVGSDACKDCHEDQFKNFVPTSHAKLANLSSWMLTMNRILFGKFAC